MKNQVYAIVVTILAIVFLIGWIAVPKIVTVEKPVIIERTVTKEVPVEKIVERIVPKEVYVFNISIFRDKAWNYVFEEGWDEFEYCDGKMYYQDEVSVKFKDDYLYKENKDTKEITFYAILKYDDGEHRCKKVYEIYYLEEEGEEPEFVITPL